MPLSRALPLSLALTSGLLALTLLPRVRGNERLTWAFWGAAAALLAWQGYLAWHYRKVGTTGATRVTSRSTPVGGWFQRVTPRPQHYVQSLCQFSIYAYWGWYWAPVYAYAPLLLAQLVFAYAFDMLLSWTRRQPYALGFGPFPIVFSTNLFLWFKDDWFAWQFALIAVGFLGKAFVRWQRDGRSVHIFNPSAFTLAVFSLVLLATDTTHLTWGPEIATTFGLGPNIYAVIFLVGLVVMYFFAITPVTAAAAGTLFALSALYVALTGVPYFVDSEIPSAVFLGLHLLVTDPSTSPRSTLGRVIFGVLYGLGVFALYALLGALGLPTFYDKLLCVPLLNLAVPAIDRTVAALGTRSTLAQVAVASPLGPRNLAYMAVWVIFFGTMTAAGATDGRHRGDSLPFWQQACAAGKPAACERLLRIETSYCNDNAGWACNEVALHYQRGDLAPADPDRAFALFARACEARFQAGCLNLLADAPNVRADPRSIDLRLLVREGGPNLVALPESEVYTRACQHGWSFACAQRSSLQ